MATSKKRHELMVVATCQYCPTGNRYRAHITVDPEHVIVVQTGVRVMACEGHRSVPMRDAATGETTLFEEEKK